MYHLTTLIYRRLVWLCTGHFSKKHTTSGQWTQVILWTRQDTASSALVKLSLLLLHKISSERSVGKPHMVPFHWDANGLVFIRRIVRATAGPAKICQRSESEELWRTQRGGGRWGTCGESPPSLFLKGGTFKNKQITTEKTRAKLTPLAQTIQSTKQEKKQKTHISLWKRGERKTDRAKMIKQDAS